MKCAMLRPTTSGSVNTASTELIAVSVMLSATSPPARWLKRFADVPPGDATSSIMPTASTPLSPNASTSPRQIAGRMITWQVSAMTAALGYLATLAKSATVRVRPSPNITRPSASGRKICTTSTVASADVQLVQFDLFGRSWRYARPDGIGQVAAPPPDP